MKEKNKTLKKLYEKYKFWNNISLLTALVIAVSVMEGFWVFAIPVAVLHFYIVWKYIKYENIVEANLAVMDLMYKDKNTNAYDVHCEAVREADKEIEEEKKNKKEKDNNE